MKSILISIKPKWVAKILNGEKTIEIRKTAPKCDLPVDVCIYCTEPHAKEVLSLFVTEIRPYVDGRACEFIERKRVDNPNMRWSICNGKVVAKFTLREVEKIDFISEIKYEGDALKGNVLKYNEEIRKHNRICKEACMMPFEVVRYLDTKCLGSDNPSGMIGYVWHISDLVIFDEPKTLSKHPPQSWCYVEEKE